MNIPAMSGARGQRLPRVRREVEAPGDGQGKTAMAVHFRHHWTPGTHAHVRDQHPGRGPICEARPENERQPVHRRNGQAYGTFPAGREDVADIAERPAREGVS